MKKKHENTEVEFFFPNQNISQIIANPKKWLTTIEFFLFMSVTFVCTMKPPSFWPLNFQAHHLKLKRLCSPASWTSADRRCRRRASSWQWWWWGGPACGGGRPSAPGLSAGQGQGEGRGQLLSAAWHQLCETRDKNDSFWWVRGCSGPCDRMRSASPPGNTTF